VAEAARQAAEGATRTNRAAESTAAMAGDLKKILATFTFATGQARPAPVKAKAHGRSPSYGALQAMAG
jgi:hypothetical protein